MAKNIFAGLRGRGLYLDNAVTEVDVDALQDLLSELVAESDPAARQELADKVLAMLEDEPETDEPVIGKVSKSGKPVAASFASGAPANSFVDYCRESARTH